MIKKKMNYLNISKKISQDFGFYNNPNTLSTFKISFYFLLKRVQKYITCACWKHTTSSATVLVAM